MGGDAFAILQAKSSRLYVLLSSAHRSENSHSVDWSCKTTISYRNLMWVINFLCQLATIQEGLERINDLKAVSVKVLQPFPNLHLKSSLL